LNLFGYGFRIFFFLSGISALVLVAGWLHFLFTGTLSEAISNPIDWHGHEMLFGFVGAMIAGFLLTAVPNWTKEKARTGLPLMILAALWIAARILLVLTDSKVAGIVDLAFFPGLLCLVLPPLVRRRQPKTLIFLPILFILWLSNLLVHLETWKIADTAREGLYLGMGLIVLLITIIGGRVIPFFTRRALETTPQSYPWAERLSILTVILLPFVEIFQPQPMFVLIWAVIGTVSHSVRLWGWRASGVWGEPLLWVLHLGYAWLVAGFALKGLAALEVVPTTAAVHAYTAGTMGVVGLGIMSRASLGHSGRPLKASTITVCSYVLINLAALARVFGPITGLDPQVSYGVSGSLWCLAFVLFLWVYTPILAYPRADGKPG
jgi:uncharacterized protein involved in response to NO